MKYSDLFNGFDFCENVDLKIFSTMKVGGIGKFIIYPKNEKELLKIMKILQKNDIKHYILGNGSNTLFDDNGFQDVLISLRHFNKIERVGESVLVGGGVNLFALNNFLQKNGLSGFEWSYGIPASVGGFIKMNGGCFGHEVMECVESVFVAKNGQILEISKKLIKFAYRETNLENCVIFAVKMHFFNEKSEIILQKMLNYYNLKKESQPCEKFSLGSVFKRCFLNGEIVYVSKLIDNMGLKGVKIGGAEISTKHAGFIVNSANATSKDILKLIELVERKLWQCGVSCEREIVVLKERL